MVHKLTLLEIKLGVNLQVKLGVGSKTGSTNSVLAFLTCTDGSVLAFLKCTDRSVLIFLKFLDGSVLAHLRFPMQSAPVMSTNIRIFKYSNKMALEYYSYLCSRHFSSTNIFGYSFVDFWTTEYIQKFVHKFFKIRKKFKYLLKTLL